MPNQTVRVKTPVGMRKSYFAPITQRNTGAHPTYGTKIDMGAAVKGYVTVNANNITIEGDDAVLLRGSEFTGAKIDEETTLSDLSINATLYGHTYTEEGGEVSKGEDEPPAGAYAFIEPLLKQDKSLAYRATFFYNVTADAAAEKTEADTKKTSGLDPKYNAVSFNADVDETGEWRFRQEYATMAAAETALDNLFSGTSA